MKRYVSIATYVGVGFALAGIASVALSSHEGDPTKQQLVEAIESKGQMDQLINGDTLTVVKFYAPWCGFCKRIAEPYKQIAQKSSAKFAEINGDTEVGGNLAKEHGISGFPMFVFFQNGKRIDIVEGADEQALQEKIEKYTRKGSAHKPKKATVQDIQSENQFKDLLANNKVTVVKFFAPWCGYCRTIADRYEKLAGKHSAAFAEVNCANGEGRKIAQQYKVAGFPTIIIFSGSTSVGSVVGAQPKLEEMIARHIKSATK